MKKVCSIILTVMMIVCMIPITVLPVSAEGETEVTYVDRYWDEDEKKVVEETKTASATAITASSTSLAGGWYYVDGTVMVSSTITVSGTSDNPTCIILADGCNLTANKCILVPGSNSLVIYGQANDTGTLIAKGTGSSTSATAGIGGKGSGAVGSITINGGTVTATGSKSSTVVFGAGIGGGNKGAGGTVTINGGNVTANGTTGIGGGSGSAGGTLTVNGGKVTATSIAAGAGIGSAGGQSTGGNVTINGGEVKATGGSQGAGIGGAGNNGQTGTVTINGGTVTATGNGYAAGIGGAGGKGNVTINGGSVTATGGEGGAGIGGKSNGAGVTVTITGGEVTATGGRSGNGSGAGIGGGNHGAGGTLTVSGGKVTATGGDFAAGIGGGAGGAGGTVTISGGTVNAGTTTAGGAGIGGGYRGEGATVTITGGTVTAMGGVNENGRAPGIGAGRESTEHGTIEAYFDAINAGDEAPGTPTTLENYLTARSAYVSMHTHDFTASYTDNGNGTHTAVCACTITGTTEAHTFVNGVCTFCGAEEPTHEHVFSTEWTSDETAHWHVCTAEDCDIEDYSTCGLEGAAYGAHVYDQEVVADRYLKSEAIYTRGGIYYMSCKCGACDKSDTAATFTDSENRSLSECFWMGVFEYGLQIGRQGKLGEDNSISTEAGRTIIPLTVEQLGEIGDCLTILANDGNGDFTLTVDCVYTYFYDVTDGEETLITAEELGYAAFIILDKKSNDSPLTGYGYFRVYNGDAVDEDYFMFDALYPSAVID